MSVISASLKSTIREEYTSGRLSMEEISERLRIGMPIIKQTITSEDKQIRKDNIAEARARRNVRSRQGTTSHISQSGILTTIEQMLGRRVR